MGHFQQGCQGAVRELLRRDLSRAASNKGLAERDSMQQNSYYMLHSIALYVKPQHDFTVSLNCVQGAHCSRCKAVWLIQWEGLVQSKSDVWMACMQSLKRFLVNLSQWGGLCACKSVPRHNKRSLESCLAASSQRDACRIQRHCKAGPMAGACCTWLREQAKLLLWRCCSGRKLTYMVCCTCCLSITIILCILCQKAALRCTHPQQKWVLA